VYQYEKISKKVRTQIRYIWDDAIGNYYVRGSYDMHSVPNNNGGWHVIRDTLLREKGLETLANQRNAKEECIAYLYECTDIDDLLDIVELTFVYIQNSLGRIPEYQRDQLTITQSPDSAIDELNIRLREAGIGYQFESGEIIRVDNQALHAEVVKPALTLLSDSRFAGAQEEYLAAHAHYRSREYKDAVTDANNAFESAMKTICELKGWEYPSGASASNLIGVISKNGLLPDYLDKSFQQLAATLKTGLPQVRNEEGGHGQGSTPKEAPEYIAAYALHLAAAKIVLLVEAFNDSE